MTRHHRPSIEFVICSVRPPSPLRWAACAAAFCLAGVVAASATATLPRLAASSLTSPASANSSPLPSGGPSWSVASDVPIVSTDLPPIGTPGGDATPTPSDGPGSTDAPAIATLPPCPGPPTGLAAASVITHGSRATKVVALTFDDGWGPATTSRILRVLERMHVNATFFPVGLAISRDPDTWRSIVSAGYPIGDHTFDHRDLEGLCYPDQLAELTHQALVCHDVLGIVPQPIMRPPYGASDEVTRLAASGAGQRDVVLWDVDTKDWTGISADAIAARALAGTNGSIIVMHTFVANTAAALPRIIAGYRARGFRFVTVGQLLGIPGPVPFS